MKKEERPKRAKVTNRQKIRCLKDPMLKSALKKTVAFRLKLGLRESRGIIVFSLGLDGVGLTEDIQFFIKNYNTATREMKVAEGRVVHFTEEDVERVYGLYRGREKIMMLDRLGVEPGDRVPVLRPTVRYWTSTVMKNRLQQIDDIGGFQNCYIINWDKLAEADDVIWFESKELRSRRKIPGIESGGFEPHDEGVNVGSFSDVADIGLDALLSAPGDDFVKEGFEVYASQVVSLDPAEGRMGKTFPEDNPEDAVGVESTLKEVGEGEQVGEGEHVTSGGSMEVETDAVVVDNIDAVETTMEQGSVKGFGERMEVVNTGAVEVSVGEHVRPGSKRIKYDSRFKCSPSQTMSGKKAIVKNSRLKIQVEAMRMQELAAKEKELEGKEQDKEIEGIAVEFPGPCTQEFVTRIEALEVFANDIYKDEALSLALLRYIWSEDLPSEEILYELEDNDCRLSRDDFLDCAPGGEVSNFFVNSFYDMLLRSVATAKASMQRWIFSLDVVTMCNSPSEDAIEYAMDHLQGKGLPAVTWTDCDYWMFPFCTGKHWVVYCVNFMLKRFEYLDSLDKECFEGIYLEVGKSVAGFAKRFIPMIRHDVSSQFFDGWEWFQCRGLKQPDNNSCGVFALNFLQCWSGEVEEWMKDNWMLPDNVNYRRSETCLRLLLSTTNSLKNDVCTKALNAFPPEEEDSEDDKEGRN
ncbi:hypothetical protein LINGRAHAP2_LOCUS18057 [Linum grandiflorum]